MYYRRIDLASGRGLAREEISRVPIGIPHQVFNPQHVRLLKVGYAALQPPSSLAPYSHDGGISAIGLCEESLRRPRPRSVPAQARPSERVNRKTHRIHS